jgi:hypothetical protein
MEPIPRKEVTAMLLMQHHEEGLRLRLLVIGIPKPLIAPMVTEFKKWEIHSGVEWTIKRLKGLKVDLIRLRSGLEPLTWLRKNRSGSYAGPLGSLIRWSLKNDRNFRRGIQAFMAYSFYIFGSVTESQKKKFLDGINADSEDGLDERFHRSFRGFVHHTLRRRRISFKASPLVTYSGSPNKKAPRLFSQPSVPQGEQPLDDLQLFNTGSGRVLYAKYSSLYKPLLAGIGERVSHLDYIKETLDARGLPAMDDLRGGEIHFIQEPGGKLRSVASPFRIHQEALRPLGNLLYDVVRDLPWDCTHKQSHAQSTIMSHLGRGGQVHSVDLSSATDLFPLSIQMDVLRSLLPADQQIHADLFEDLARSTWKSPIGDLRWTKGQPLGLFPSFGLFTLTHGLLLLHLADGRYTDQFFVLGDDVVILDNCLYNKYIAMLDIMRCPWSPEKSLSSSTLCEFAGKIITKDWVIPQLKWRRMSDDNFLDVSRLLGKRSRCLLSRRQKGVFDRVAHLCEPIGLNFSNPGDNLEKMVERTLEFYSPEKAVLASLMDLRRRINRHVYASSEHLCDVELHEMATTFDEKVRTVLSQTIFSRWDSLSSIGYEAIETIPAALGIKPRLPLREFQPTRLSTLERYERFKSPVMMT